MNVRCADCQSDMKRPNEKVTDRSTRSTRTRIASIRAESTPGPYTPPASGDVTESGSVVPDRSGAMARCVPADGASTVAIPVRSYRGAPARGIARMPASSSHSPGSTPAPNLPCRPACAASSASTPSRQPRDTTRRRRVTQPLPRPHHHRPWSSPGRPRSGPVIALVRLRADKSSSQRCRSSTAVQHRNDWYGASHSPTSESAQSSMASTLSGTIQQGSPVTALPSNPSRTSSARKSVNGSMSWRTLASSSAAM